MKKRGMGALLALALLLSLSVPALALSPSSVYGRRAIVMDYDTGEIYFEKNADERGPVASMTKLMTAYMVYEDIAAGKITPDTMVPISAHAAAISADRTYSGVHTFKKGASYPVGTLLHLSLIPSCCASSIALGEFISPDGTEAGCVARMNAKTAEWGIAAHFGDCAGLEDKGNSCSARGMAELACRLIRDYPQMLEITSKSGFRFEGTWYKNSNTLLSSGGCAGIDGLKSGYTPLAGSCFTGTALRNGRRVISVSMKSGSSSQRMADTRTLLNYGFECVEQRAEQFAALAHPSVQTVLVDGTAVSFDMYALWDAQGQVTNYIRLRDLAAVLSGTPARFEVGYEDGVVTLWPGRDYTFNGSERVPTFMWDRPYGIPAGGTQVNGLPTALDAIYFTDGNGGGYTYYKLRDLGQALGFGVDWSPELGVSVTTAQTSAGVDYTLEENWAYRESGDDGKAVDVFFVAPTVYLGSGDSYQMPLDDAAARGSFVNAINMEKGIYDDNARFFAPYYRQAGLNAYELDEAERLGWIDAAYRDVRDAFSWYMAHENNGRGVVLAGFSQGGELALRLAQEFFGQDASQLVACYAIGWRVTQADLDAAPALSFAGGEEDAGTIVAFNSEAESVTGSIFIPQGTATYAINPLNWKTDSTPADKSLNKGAYLIDLDTGAVKEVPGLTGAYIDPVRGALKVTDVAVEDYPAVLYTIMDDGVYHLYDYQFFYRDLEENVQRRTAAWLSRTGGR